MSAGFLLPAQTLLSLCSADANPALAWAKTVSTADLRVAVTSSAQALARAEQMSDAQHRTRLRAALTALVNNIVNDAGPQLDFGESAAQVWQALIHDTGLVSVSQVERQVYAIAMDQNLAIVEARRPDHQHLQSLGLQVVPL